MGRAAAVGARLGAESGLTDGFWPLPGAGLRLWPRPRPRLVNPPGPDPAAAPPC